MTARRRFLIAAACIAGFMMVSRISSAHEPITTKMTFNREVVRILQRNCLGCHRPGGVAPMSLATYEEARPWAKAIKEELLERRMPPWFAAKGFGQFHNAPSLTQRDIDLIVNWVEGGAPKGDQKDLPETQLYSSEWPLGPPYLVLSVGPHEVAGDADEHCFITAPTNLKEDRMIAAIDLRPGVGSVVRSAAFYVQSGSAPNEKAVGKNGEGKDIDNLLATWMPGQKRTALTQGYGLLLPARSRIKVDIQYRGSGEAVKDSSEVGIYFAKTPVNRQVLNFAPAREKVQGNRLKALLVIPDDMEAVGITPTGDSTVESLEVTAYRPDGTSEALIWTRLNKTGWAPTYYYKRPVILPKATRVEVICYLSNAEDGNASDPPASPRQLCDLLLAVQSQK